MDRKRKKSAAIGIRVKSGWATAVLLSGPLEAPQLIDKRVIQLSVASMPDSKQPYHVFETLSGTRAEKLVEKLKQVVTEATNDSVSGLIAEYQKMGYRPDSATLVVGSQIDPAAIKNPHIRWHAQEGQLFRRVVEEALQSHRISYSIVVERNAYAAAAKALKRPETDLKRAVKALGRSMPPWRIDEQMSALGGWIALL